MHVWMILHFEIAQRICTSSSINGPNNVVFKPQQFSTFLIHLLDSMYHAADNGLANSLFRPQCCIRHNWPHHSPQSSHFQFRHHGLLSQLAWVLSAQQVFLRHFRLLFLFHITFILWCSPRLSVCHPFHSLCLTFCFNCILSRCQSNAAICWQYTAFCLPFPFVFI